MIFVISSIFIAVVVILLYELKSGDSDSKVAPTPTPSVSPSLSYMPTSTPSLTPTGFYELQRLSLRNFYKNHNGEYWKNSSGWDGVDGDLETCEWFGISCGKFQDVIEIQLSNNNLTGEINTEDMDILETLQHIDLSANNLTGNMTVITNQLVSITSLDILDLRLTEIDGEVSEAFCDKHGSSGNSIKDFDGIFVDCRVGCSCCFARDEYCTCVDMEGFIDSYGDS